MAEKEKIYYVNEAGVSDIITRTIQKLMDGGYIPNVKTDFTKFDKENVQLQKNMSDLYDPNLPYSKGEICIYNNLLYVCKTDIPVPEEFNLIKWEVTNLSSIIKNISDKLDAIVNP